ncbi:MAG: PAS domain S-box protein [Thermoleophilaceae bacterium]|nr:PAS domain S-box protein [Thermoleophilaceae bacterium]
MNTTAHFNEFLELIPDATIAVDGRGQIVFVNDEATSVFGYERKEMIGLNVDLLVPERFRDEHGAHRKDFFSKPRRRPVGAELNLFALRADGSEFPAEIALSVVGTEEQPLALAAIRDITDRVRFEKERNRFESQLELNQSQRLESIGQLAGGIAHDFNNLLGVIINYADFAIAELSDRPEVREDVEQIQEAATRAAALTRQLLVFSRREAVKLQPIQLNDALTGLEKLLRRVLGENIELITKFEPALWTVVADPGQIEQVTVNLAVNARDAMPESGRLEIETSNVELDEEYASSHPDSPAVGRYVRLTISDSGAGMDAETVARVFEPYFTTKPKPVGTGLGLATVYGIVKNLGGNIFVYSEPGRGTSIKIHLPASDQNIVTGDRDKHRLHAQGSGEHVLLVEDEDAVRQMVMRVLENNGYEVTHFARAADALRALEHSGDEFALLLTDVVMPDMQGTELARHAARVRPEMPTLFMSGYSELILDKVDAIHPETNLIEKPFTVNDLLSEVGKSIRKGVA